MKNLTQYHWTSGGTGVTNFDRNKLDLYRQAVELYDDDNLVISETGMSPWPRGCSLHDLSDVRRDLSDFWAIYRILCGDWPYYDDLKSDDEAIYNKYISRQKLPRISSVTSRCSSLSSPPKLRSMKSLSLRKR